MSYGVLSYLHYHTFWGYFFDLHNANGCGLFKVSEPVIAKTIHIKKDQTLTRDKVSSILTDVTEVTTQRPKKKQKEKYLAKKKRQTLKSELAMREDGKIIHVSI